MGERDHSITCEVCGLQRGGLNDYKCHCDLLPTSQRGDSMPVKHYAKKRESVRAVQWLGGMTPEVTALIGELFVKAEGAQLSLGNGWYARSGDWILSASGEDVVVVGDEVFRRCYEEVDTSARAFRPTDDEHDAAGLEFVRALDGILIDGLRLSREEHPGIFRNRDVLVRNLRRLLEDHAYVSERRERQRLKEKIAKELA